MTTKNLPRIKPACTCTASSQPACCPTCPKTEDEHGCRDCCDKPRHALVRELTNALDHLRAVGDKVKAYDRPEEFDQQMDWEQILDAVRGLDWILDYAVCSVDGCTFSCCHCDRKRERLAKVEWRPSARKARKTRRRQQQLATA